MARPLRIDFDGAIHHVTARGNDRRPIALDDEDSTTFLRFLAQAVRRFNWSLTAWVLMTNHFHLVVQTHEPNLSRGMHWLNGTYADWFNRRHGRSGHLFQGRFKSFLVERETYLRRVLRYVVLNPVRAGMVTLPEDYEWSSYRATAGLDAAPDWLELNDVLELFHEDKSQAESLYRDYVRAATDGSESLWPGALGGMFLGSERWARQMRRIVESRIRSTDHPRKQRAVGRPGMPEIIATVSRLTGLPSRQVRAREGAAFRRLVAWIGWHEGLLTLATIAAALRLRSEGYVSRLVRRCEGEFSTDVRLLACLDDTVALLRA